MAQTLTYFYELHRKIMLLFSWNSSWNGLFFFLKLYFMKL